MAKFLINWETDFGDNYPELAGVCVVTANDEQEAAKIFNSISSPKQIITNIRKEEN